MYGPAFCFFARRLFQAPANFVSSERFFYRHEFPSYQAAKLPYNWAS